MPKYWALGAALTVLMGWPLIATAIDPADEYAKLIQEHSRIATLDGGFFGDHVGLSTGNLGFTQTDVSLPGNDALAVQAGRRFEVGGYPAKGHFADWDLDIPHLHGVFGGARPTTVHWEVNDVDPDHRCSEFNSPPEISTTPPNAGLFSPDEYWQGTFFYLPGSGDQELLYGGDVPASGGPYYATTREGAAARCLSALATTSEVGSTGEGFEVVTPDGTVYTFDQMVSRYADGLDKSDPMPLLRPRGSPRKDGASSRLPRGTQGSGAGTNAVECCSMQRREFFLYPTKVTDRFGNTVIYTWDSSNPWRLRNITASDGRQLDFTYSSSDPASILVQSVSAHSVSDGPRTWNYAYAGTMAEVHLVTVTQPDLQAWHFSLLDLHLDAKPHSHVPTCDALGFTNDSWSGTITAPSGATAQYTLAPKLFGRSWGFRDCKLHEDATETITEPYLFVSVAITAKTITGPGLPSGLTWTYTYGSPNNCWDPYGVPAGDPDAVICTSNSPKWRTTTVTDPDLAVSHYTFGNRIMGDGQLMGNEGLLLTEEHGVGGGTALRTETFTYGEGNAQPYGGHQGSSLRRRGDWIVSGQRRPQLSAVTTLQGQTFSRDVPQACSGNYCFDIRARPTNVVRTGINTPAGSQTEVIAYDDDTTHWVLGQVAQRTINGTVSDQTTFDASHRPWKIYAFGKLKQTLTYNTDGTLATAKDGNNNVTTYSSWKRGIPRAVAFADSASRAAVVNDSGWITSVTDENGYATGYTYDSMGRINQVTYPTETSGGWNVTTSDFAPAPGAENGLALGHWRETVTTGSGNKVTVFDALWRPVLVHEYDASAAGTDRWMATAYDKAGRVIEASYPLATAPTMTSAATWGLPGVRTGYDLLGRPTSVQQDSELGVLTTTTAYLTDGFKRRITDARGHATTETFMAWDTPTFDLPVQIDAPEDQRTTIARDIFGKPTAITREDTP
jgi:YD repeat-containing protein